MREGVPVRAILVTIGLVVATLAAVALLFAVRHVIFDVVVSVFLALVLNAPVAWLQQRRVPRGWAITVVSFVLLIAVAGITASIAAPLATQGTDVARHGPEYLKQAEEGRGPIGRLAKRLHLENRLREAVPAVSKSLSRLSSRLIDFGRGIASAAARTAIILVLTIFMLVEGPRVVEAVQSAIPPDSRASATRIGRHAAASVSSYTLGILFLALLNGLVTATALAVTRVPFVLALAMWAGVVDILPIVGGLLAILVVALFAFAKGITTGIVVVIVMVVYQQVKNHVLYPIVVGRAVRLNALIVLVAVLAGAELAKIPGAILAIPVAAVIHVAITELLGPRVPWLSEEPPAERAVAEASGSGDVRPDD